MKSIVSVFFLIVSVSCFAQNTKGTIKIKKVESANKDTVVSSNIGLNAMPVSVTAPLTIVEKMPTFPGGQKEMDAFIQKNLKYPTVEKKGGNQVTVWVTFKVEVDGTLSDVKLLKGINGSVNLDLEAIRVVKMMPKWNPGMQNGRNVEVQVNLPINFKLK